MKIAVNVVHNGSYIKGNIYLLENVFASEGCLFYHHLN